MQVLINPFTDTNSDMNSDWQQTLERAGARIELGIVADFGDPAGELFAARAGNVMADLSHLAALRISGEDAESFLQGQLSCDVKAIASKAMSLGSYCTPKGRMLASFHLLRAGDAFHMVLSSGIAAAIQKRLSMFVLRAKVKIESTGDALVLLGLSGPLCSQPLAAPVEGFDMPDGRRLLLVPAETAAAAWSALAGSWKPVGSRAWQWLDIHHGIPLITQPTQDQLVPQMANLELIGGVSFKKGCYPGQEIVARTQYLGKVKRRMFRAHLEVEAAPGDALYSDDLGDQSSGLVVSAQPAPEGGYDVLAVAQLGSHDASTVRLKSPQGPALRFEPLPYAIS